MSYEKNILACAGCGHSLDFHKNRGSCRVERLTGESCNCIAFVPKRQTHDVPRPKVITGHGYNIESTKRGPGRPRKNRELAEEEI